MSFGGGSGMDTEQLRNMEKMMDGIKSGKGADDYDLGGGDKAASDRRRGRCGTRRAHEQRCRAGGTIRGLGSGCGVQERTEKLEGGREPPKPVDTIFEPLDQL